MGEALKSAGGLLGFDTGPKAPQADFSNPALAALNQYSTNNPMGQSAAQVQGNSVEQQGLGQMLGQLQSGQGLQQSQTGQLDKLQNQGFNLTPGDQTMYGQESGNIARQFGQQGNQAASNLASRGLSNSGAAGATFSGLSGNQNEMLSQAQQNIAQQRFQNTMSQIGQTQNFLGALNGQNNQAAGNYASQGENDIANTNAANVGAMSAAGQGQLNQNNTVANYGINAANFEQQNKPQNFMDIKQGAATSALGAGSTSVGKQAGQNIAGGMGGGAAKALI